MGAERFLNERQMEAVNTFDGPVSIRAGAGSGKTTVLINRVANLIQHGVSPEMILLLTFTNKAADEMKERAVKMADERCGKITACTFHSFCALMLRRYADQIGWDPNFSIIAPSDCADSIDYVKATNDNKFKKLRGFPPNRQVVNIISGAKNKMISIDEYMEQTNSKYLDHKHEIVLLAKQYEQYKKEHSMMDYDDLLVLFLHLLETCPQAQEHISNAYAYIMVDEYQDTNTLQEKILFAMRTTNDNLAIVGDDAQSIYAFRGAQVENILEFADKMGHCREISLDINYRSNDEIVQLSNEVINNNIIKGFKKDMHGTYQSGHKPKLIVVKNQRAEAEDVYRRIKELYQDGNEYSEMAVIARTSNSMMYLESILVERGIPYVKYGGKKLMEMECVLDVLAYLKCLSNQGDQLSWYRVLKQYYMIGETYASRISPECITGRDFLLRSKNIKKSFQHETTLLYDVFERFDRLEFHELLKAVVEYYLKLRKRNIETAKLRDESDRTERLAKLEDDKNTLGTLIDVADKYEDLVQFLDSILLDAVQSTNAWEEDALVLTTIHSAKGLEFGTVFVLDCMNEYFPRASGSEEWDEELRCFYVAITRAKENLIIYAPQLVVANGRPIYGDVTPFLNGCEDMLEILQ